YWEDSWRGKEVSFTGAPLIKKNKLLMTLLCSQSNAIPIYLPDLTYIPPVISYHPSSSYICPSLYLDPIGPPTMIIMLIRPQCLYDRNMINTNTTDKSI